MWVFPTPSTKIIKTYFPVALDVRFNFNFPVFGRLDAAGKNLNFKD
jgi:hypothetical protein